MNDSERIADLESRLKVASAERDSLRQSLFGILQAGHDNDCLFCGLKDRSVCLTLGIDPANPDPHLPKAHVFGCPVGEGGDDCTCNKILLRDEKIYQKNQEKQNNAQH